MPPRGVAPKSKYALVTGASTGIGREIAIAFGKLGWIVGLVARRKEKLTETKRLVEAAGGGSQRFGFVI